MVEGQVCVLEDLWQEGLVDWEAGFGNWSIGTITTSGSNGGFCFEGFFSGGVPCEGSFAFAWSVALVFEVLHIGGSFSAGGPFSAIWYLLTWF